LSNAPVIISYPPELPVSAKRDEIVAALRAHRVLIVAGETGSGKTTQLPKMCLEAGLGQRGRIGCTQPRRVAAMSVSRRVAEELGVTWGREVGCKIRFNDDTSRDTQIKFMTDGVLLAEIQSDPLLRAYSALIVDEAHERSLNIDFLLGYLQELLKRRPHFNVLITSATIDTHAFSEAFGGAPIIEVSGRMFPVDIRYAPLSGGGTQSEEGDPTDGGADDPPPLPGDAGFVEAAARAVEDALIETDSGDVLVFMPTERDIREARELLEESLGSEIEVLALFGRMPGAEQQRIFAPGGRRRVVIATNVAETSITIPRIGVVIDTGLARMSRYNPRTRTKRLPVEPISQSSANQRAGRAGRVRDGLCIRLYDRDDFEKRPRFTQPEIQRANLAEVILRMKAFGLGDIETFPFLNPPSPQAIRAGYKLLEELGAVLEGESDGGQQTFVLTGLGNELARLPVDPTLGRMLLQAASEGVLAEVLAIASGLSIPDPRERPDDAREAAAAAHQAFVDPRSDFLTLLNIWNAAPASEGGSVHVSRNALRRFCKANYLSLTRMREWRDLYRQLKETVESEHRRWLHAAQAPRAVAATRTPEVFGEGAKGGPRGATHPRKSLSPADLAREQADTAIHRSILTGLLGQVAHREARNVYKASSNREPMLFPGSGLYERGQKKPKPAAPGRGPIRIEAPSQPEWIMAAEVVQTSQLFARTVAGVDPQWVVELGAHLCKFSYVHPAWSTKAGRVLVWERVLIYGLELSRRQIDYGRVNPKEATELFIRSALVSPDEEVRIQHRFFAENAKLRDRIENALTKVRSHRVHDLNEAFYAFYAERIESVSSVHDLDKLIRSRITREPAFLCATEADVLGGDDIAYDRAAFPDRVAMGNTVLPLSYAYNPGEEADGVTVRVPLPLAERLSSAQLQWMVPGLREEQTGALLRALPKTVRKQLMPLEPKIREIAAEFEPGDGDLLAALAKFIDRKYRVAVRPEEWRALPDYLRPRIEVVDRKNQTVSAGRDLDAVRAALETKGVQSDAWERAAQRWEKHAITGWSVGDLPESVVVENIGGAPLLAYPGLVMEGGNIHLRLFRKREDAAIASPAAVRQLAEWALARDLAWLAKEMRVIARPKSNPGGTRPSGPSSLGSAFAALEHVPGFGSSSGGFGLPGKPQANTHPPIMTVKPAKQTAPTPARPTADSLAETACRHIGEQLFRLDPLFPLTERRFQDMLQAARREMPMLARRVAELAGQILAMREAICTSPKRYPGLEQDLERLVPADFLVHTPNPRLTDLLRYLRGVQIRAERAAVSPLAQSRDAEKAAKLAPFISGGEVARGIPLANREAFRWLLEEFRISIFAQELGTSQPVSAERLRALAE